MVQKNAKSLLIECSQHATVPFVEITCSIPHRYSPAPLITSAHCYQFLRTVYDFRKLAYKEFFYVALLDIACNCIGYSLIGIGTATCVAVNNKEILQLALLSNASRILLTHNHPSGTLTPSHQDKLLTNKIKQGAELFDIEVMDHIIISHNGYFSFADEGLL